MTRFFLIEILLILFLSASCLAPQNKSLNNEGFFSKVPVMLSEKQTLGNGKLEINTIKTFDYIFKLNTLSGPKQTNYEWNATGLVDRIPMGTMPFIKSNKLENVYVRLKGPCTYEVAEIFLLLIGVGNKEFHCPAEVVYFNNDNTQTQIHE